MILAVDVHYQDPDATVAGLLFPDWPDAQALSRHRLSVPEVAAYEPGAFYKRELPCLLALVDTLPVQPTCIIIDGHVHLGRGQQPGLGWHLWNALAQRPAVIGVAKTPFHDSPLEAELLRGREATRPLYISSVGLPLDQAKDAIARMHGPHRLPTLLKAVDGLCRGRGEV